jgi:hypothetical protein
MARRIILKNNGLNSNKPTPTNVSYLGLSNGTLSIQSGTTINNVDDATYYIALNFIDLEEFVYIAPESFKINSITNPSSIGVTITINDSPYTLGDNINELDVIKVNVDEVGFIKLICEGV